MTFELNINNKTYTIESAPDMPLLWALRDLLDLTGTKYGCGIAVCGACTVLINKRAVRSCMVNVQSCVGQSITTIEGLSEDGTHPVQKAWEAMSVPQCGYCQAGQMMTLAGLLEQTKKPSEAQVNSVMSQVICRCGTYHRIRKAVNMAIEEINK